MFSWNSFYFDDPADVGNLISGSSAFSKTSLNIWKFTVHVLLKPGLENFEHYFTSVWDECNCAVVWAFFGIAFLCDWNENWPFPVLLYFFVKTSISKMRSYWYINMLFERLITTKKFQWKKNQRLGVEIEVDFYTWWSPYYNYFVKSPIILTAQLLENVEVIE